MVLYPFTIKYSLLNPLFYRVPQEISREILKFIDPVKLAAGSRSRFIRKRGLPKFRWCSNCGEYLCNKTEWVFLYNYTDADAKSDLIFYRCNSCDNSNAICL